MKREMNLKEIQLRMGLSVIAYDSLNQLQNLTHSDQREEAEQLAARNVMLLQERHIDFGLCSTAPVAHLFIEAEPAQETEAEPAQEIKAEPATTMETAEPVQTDYNALLEQQEQEVRDEVGTKV